MTTLETRQFHKIFERIRNYNRIVIIGYPKSGKSMLFKKLTKKLDYQDLITKDDHGYTFVQTDVYKDEYEYKEQLYRIIEDLQVAGRFIVEGIQGYRLLRKIEENKMSEIQPDLIILCETDRPVDPRHVAQRKGLDKIWNDYKQIVNKIPDFIIYKN